jgi:hypothetical protein
MTGNPTIAKLTKALVKHGNYWTPFPSVDVIPREWSGRQAQVESMRKEHQLLELHVAQLYTVPLR